MTLDKLEKGNQLKNEITEVRSFLEYIDENIIGIDKINIEFRGKCISGKYVTYTKEKDNAADIKTLTNTIYSFFEDKLEYLEKEFAEL